MKERVRRELDLVELRYGAIEVGPSLDWFIVKRLPAMGSWNKRDTQVLVLIPGGYPTTPPDNFYTDFDLRLANGNIPASTSGEQGVGDRRWLLFSYHVESGDWKPDPVPENGHNLLTFLDGVAKRLTEAN